MPDEYQWPQKVRRYRITCPFQRLLVVKHERQIDWSGARIESPAALDQHVREVMLPRLKAWISPDSAQNNYCKTIHLDRMLANPAEHIQQARQLRREQGDEAARQFLLGHINRSKMEQFDGWWDYLMQQNLLYKDHPAFQYLVLRPVLESSTAKDTRAPVPVDAEALAHLFERMAEGRVHPSRKLLPLLCELMAFGRVTDENRPRFGSDCIWVVIKNTDSNAANRVAALSQGSGWCVASAGMAAGYLRSSDFHLLAENGRAVVALRLNQNTAVEVQGKGNQDPGPWWPRTLLYAAARGTSFQHRNNEASKQAAGIEQELAAAQQDVRQLRTLLEEQPSKVHLLESEWVSLLDPAHAGDDHPARLVVEEAWRACIRADPLCGGLVPGWMAADPATKRALGDAWVALLMSDPQTCQRLPGTLARDPKFWVGVLSRDPRAWTHCPKILRKDAEVLGALKNGWLELLRRDPACESQCPAVLREDRDVLEALKRSRLEVLFAGPELRLKDVPSDLLGDYLVWKNPLPPYAAECFSAVAAEPRATVAIVGLWRHSPRLELTRCAEALAELKAHPWHFSILPAAQQDHALLRGTAIEGWTRLLRLQPALAGLVPEPLRTDARIEAVLNENEQSAAQAKIDRCLQMVRAEPSITDEELKKLGIPAGQKKDWKQVTKWRLNHWKNRLRKNWEAWQHMPKSLRNEEEVLALMRQGLGPRIRENPAIWEQLAACYRNDPCLQRVHRIATRAQESGTESDQPEACPGAPGAVSESP